MVPLVCRAWIAARRTPLEGLDGLDRRGARPAWRPDGRRPAGPARAGVVRRRRLRRAVRDRLGAEPAARRYLAERGVDPGRRPARRTCAGTGRPAEGLVEGAGWPRRSRPSRAGTSSTTSASWPPIRTVPRARELDRREFQRLFEQATQRWTAGRHDADYAEPWPAFRRAGSRGALDRATANGRPGRHGRRGQLGRPDRDRLRVPRRSRRDDPAMLGRPGRRFNTVSSTPRHPDRGRARPAPGC